MKEEFRHFVFTRVNLGYKDRIGKIKKDLFNEESWLEYRFDIFYNTCLPAMMNQTNQKFAWFIYLDIETPQKFIDAVNNKIEGKSNMKVLLKAGSFGSVLQHAKDSIMEYGGENSDYLITTRIDSDDMVHFDYVNEIQKRFKNQNYTSINFNKGLVYDLRLKILGTAINKSNPFISVIEKFDSFESIKTVFHIEHSKFIFEKERIEIKSGERMWAMTIHDLNIDTNFYGNPKLFSFSEKINGFHFSFLNRAPLSTKFNYKRVFYKKQLKKVIPYVLKKLKLNG
ncbi:putative rhamnosyl transferase [Aquiflexum gelatinilyticum]|uniref:Rhamnosyl transferase n=1 Tax=Aquiflexum gelatinilyticum TaxID=2961943 RepID=A0A9X2P802_9BACT|nr:putative rhamnosyl transferase [Aquiflexum gelatinilyticum]MCR9014849.1 putative rhamnosyl transferase [Aquiflexum gelatinilyticum]